MFELANERPPHWPSLEIPQRPSDELNCSQQSGEVNSLPRTLPIFLILLLPNSLPVSFQALLLTILDPEIRVVVFAPCFLLRFLFRGEKRDLGGGPVCSLSYLRKSLVTFDQAVFFFSVLDYSCSRRVKYFCPSRVNGRFIKRNEQRALMRVILWRIQKRSIRQNENLVLIFADEKSLGSSYKADHLLRRKKNSTTCESISHFTHKNMIIHRS